MQSREGFPPAPMWLHWVAFSDWVGTGCCAPGGHVDASVACHTPLDWLPDSLIAQLTAHVTTRCPRALSKDPDPDPATQNIDLPIHFPPARHTRISPVSPSVGRSACLCVVWCGVLILIFIPFPLKSHKRKLTESMLAKSVGQLADLIDGWILLLMNLHK